MLSGKVWDSPVAKLPWPPMLQQTPLPWTRVQWAFLWREWPQVSVGEWRSGRTPRVVYLKRKTFRNLTISEKTLLHYLKSAVTKEQFLLSDWNWTTLNCSCKCTSVKSAGTFASTVYNLVYLLSVTLLREADSGCLSQQHTVHVPLPHDGLRHLHLLAALLLEGLQLTLGFLQTLFQLATPVTVNLLA